MPIETITLPYPDPNEPVQHYVTELLDMSATPVLPIDRQLVQAYALTETAVTVSRLAILEKGDQTKITEVLDPSSIKAARNRFASLLPVPETVEELGSALLSQENPEDHSLPDAIVNDLRFTDDFVQNAIVILNTAMSGLAMEAQQIRGALKQELSEIAQASLRSPKNFVYKWWKIMLHGKQTVEDAIEDAIHTRSTEAANAFGVFDEEVANEIQTLVQRTGIKEGAQLYDFAKLSQLLLLVLMEHHVSPVIVQAATELAIQNYYNPQSLPR